MLIDKIAAHQGELEMLGFTIEYVEFEWWELSKRILRKKTSSGRDVAMKYMAESVAMSEGDILYYDTEEKLAIVVRVLECSTIVISPKDMVEMATICYEIGNKHMPLFIEGEDILLPFEAPMFKWLNGAGYHPTEQSRKLLRRLSSKSSGHHHHSHDNIIKKVINFASNR